MASSSGNFSDLFGWFKKKKQPEENQQPSFAPPENNDGAMVVQSAGGGLGTYVDLDGSVRTESELIMRYRQMAGQPEVDHAIMEIVNAAIVDDDNQEIVEVELDDLGLSPQIADLIGVEFDRVLDLLDFKIAPHDVFRQWYVDGRKYYHAIINPARPGDGLQELRPIDPRKIRKIREVRTDRIKMNNGQGDPGADLYKVVREYYLYSERLAQPNGQLSGQPQSSQVLSGLKISTDAVIYAPSGLVNDTGTMTIGYLHKAIKFTNQLRAVEDAVVIYRLVKAPERRIWYISVGNLPGPKAEVHLKNIMTRYKNRVVYDAVDGKIRDDRKFMTMYEDFFLPVREDGQSTKVETLPAGELTGRMDDVLYFQKRLYRALNVPISRMMPEDMYALGRTSQITQEEVNFTLFIDRLRRRFAHGVLLEALGKQLLLKGVMGLEDWEVIKYKIKFRWAKNNVFSELKDKEVMLERLNILNLIMPYVGRYYSNKYVRENVLMQDEMDIEEIDAEILEELDNPQYMMPEDLMMPEMGGPDAMPPPGGAPVPPKGGPPKPGKK